MHPKSSISQSLILKKSMAQRRNSKINLNITHGESRQHLPRECNTIPPDYALDNEDDEAITTTMSNKKRRTGFGTGSSSSRTKVAAKGLGRNPKGRSSNVVIEQREKIDENTFSNNIITWLTDMNVICKNAMVRYVHGTNKEVMRRGIITEKGIYCLCCSLFFSVSNFIQHKENEKLLVEKPYENIFVGDTNVSLLTCQIEAWRRHSVPAKSGYHHIVRRPSVTDNHDDKCIICANGGHLICCENCPSTYHPHCLGFQDVPGEEWFCPYCHCKYCDWDDVTDILLTCVQCLKKYHSNCSEISEPISLGLQPPSIPFCGNKCRKVHQNLEEKLGRSIPIKEHGLKLGRSIPTERELSWILVRNMDQNLAGKNSEELYLRTYCNSMVAIAAKLMEESFKDIFDKQTKTNIIQNVVYNCGSNFTRTNFSRFYTAILESEGEIISVASLRLPSPELAEMPFIATSEHWRNKGMCRILLKVVESALASMGVEHFVIPSSKDMEKSWQTKFGFIPIDKTMSRKLMNLNSLMFPDSIRLQKTVKNVKRTMLHHDLNQPPTEDL